MALIEDYQRVRKYSETLCAPLKVEDYVVQIVEFASPPKWHLGHTSWFFEEFVLKQHDDNYQPFHEQYGYLFNSYYNHAGDRILRANRGNLSRPTVEEVYAYRHYVDQAMLAFIPSIRDEGLHNLIVLGLNHEQQHQELFLTDLKYVLGHNPLLPAYDTARHLVDGGNTTEGTVAIEEGVQAIGHDGTGFAYDNEYTRHKVYINAGSINNYLVTNRDYLEFIEDGGYQNFSLWLEEGWKWVNNHNINAPLYWRETEEGWRYYTLAGDKPVNPDALLCHISFYEACAFAEWNGARLPTEFEWEVSADNLDWGQRWEWTASAYLPYPGYSKQPGAVGEYNGKFMSHQMVLRGASVATSPEHSRKTYRNFFYPHERWQFTGLRLMAC
jgi:ergothioneine biosynthesis protein EgtB